MLRPFAVVFILLFGIAAWAQTTTGALVGTVTDGTGAAIPGASVTAAETATNWQTSATTNDSGGFSIPNLPPGDYTVTIEKERFRKSVWTNVTIRVNDIQRLSAEMELGQLSDTIDVTVPLPLLQTDTSGISATIDDDD
jgi:hypothetical protein